MIADVFVAVKGVFLYWCWYVYYFPMAVIVARVESHTQAVPQPLIAIPNSTLKWTSLFNDQFWQPPWSKFSSTMKKTHFNFFNKFVEVYTVVLLFYEVEQFQIEYMKNKTFISYKWNIAKVITFTFPRNTTLRASIFKPLGSVQSLRFYEFMVPRKRTLSQAPLHPLITMLRWPEICLSVMWCDEILISVCKLFC